MSKFEVVGKEMIIKNPVKHGNGAIVYIPKAWLGERLAIIRGVKEEL